MTYQPAPHVTQNWVLSKPAATGRRGIVVSQVQAAAEAGVAMLEAGGNAIDAAVATALALAAVEPWNSGLGGIGFALVHRAGQPAADLVDFGPVAPRGLDPSAFKLTGRVVRDLFAWPQVEGDANIHGPLSFAIPSSTAGYAKMHATWGKLPLKEVIAPAIALAKRGLPQDWYTTLKVAASAAVLRLYDESARIYLPNGLPPIAPYQGATGFFRLGRLADTLEHLGRAGLRDQYEGDIAASIAADVKALGGVLSAEDLRQCEAQIRPSMQVPWRGQTLQLAGGLTAAPTMVRVLDLMNEVSFGKEPDAAWYVAFARAMKTAYAERLSGLGDVDAHAAETCTTHLTACDQDGTMVAMTTTLLSSMGSRAVLPGSGILLNNGVMWFDPRPGQPNSIGGGKRPLTNMSPVILRDGDRPWYAGGASGGRRILAAVAQVMQFVAAFGMDLPRAAHHPRIDVSGPDEVSADRRLPAAVIEALAADGPTQVVEHGVMPINFACPNVIVSQPDGTRVGMSDVASPWSAAVAQS
ncbi:MAG TPA: gamma-glutamyltransferase [Rhodopila sp.]|uniref:gamma-glutamyltransferase n=1 Tax=Rhodopila sp. TaxID=2480087 RepID=UPI002BAF0655|nr:gamma-glutamyltransferase [Rhodopila sp.]HVY16107.1 gamma-glutamyltransferase [Rhodopila sp.]